MGDAHFCETFIRYFSMIPPIFFSFLLLLFSLHTHISPLFSFLLSFHITLLGCSPCVCSPHGEKKEEKKTANGTLETLEIYFYFLLLVVLPHSHTYIFISMFSIIAELVVNVSLFFICCVFPSRSCCNYTHSSGKGSKTHIHSHTR